MLKELPGYEVIKELGRGATGTVYLCRQQNLDRMVAVKALAPVLTNEHEFRERFTREAQVMAQLRHPHIVEVFNASCEAELFIIVMEYIEGRDLQQLLADKPVQDLEQVLQIGRELLSALEHAHSSGVIHRDVKPANILVRESGQIALADFSLAHLAGESKLTKTGAVMGTIEYMAPEMLEGKPLTPRVDLYAVGLLLYELLTGTHPFRRDTAAEIMKAHLFDEPPCPKGFPPSVSDFLLKAIARNPEQRYQSATEMLSELLALESASRSEGPLTTFISEVEKGSVSLDEANRVHEQLCGVTGAPKGLSPVAVVDSAKPALKFIPAILGVLVLCLLAFWGFSSPDVEAARPFIQQSLARLDESLTQGTTDTLRSFTSDELEVVIEGEVFDRANFERRVLAALGTLDQVDIRTTLVNSPTADGSYVASSARTELRHSKGELRVLSSGFWRREGGDWELTRLELRGE